MCETACARDCVCARLRVRLCARLCSVDTEMTCRHVNKINNMRLISLFNKRTRY